VAQHHIHRWLCGVMFDSTHSFLAEAAVVEACREYGWLCDRLASSCEAHQLASVSISACRDIH
jgi:hypothetical protein